MTTTVNISLPKSLYEDAKKAVSKRGYSSFSEFIRATLRETLSSDGKNRITENGFPVWFEDRILETAKEPDEGEIWEKEEDIDRFFESLHKELEKKRHGKN